MEIPPGSIVITADQMYKEVQATHAAVTKLAPVVDEIKTELGKVLPDHESRIRRLERAVWIATGAGLIGGGGLGAVVAKLMGV